MGCTFSICPFARRTTTPPHKPRSSSRGSRGSSSNGGSKCGMVESGGPCGARNTSPTPATISISPQIICSAARDKSCSAGLSVEPEEKEDEGAVGGGGRTDCGSGSSQGGTDTEKHLLIDINAIAISTIRLMGALGLRPSSPLQSVSAGWIVSDTKILAYEAASGFLLCASDSRTDPRLPVSMFVLRAGTCISCTGAVGAPPLRPASPAAAGVLVLCGAEGSGAASRCERTLRSNKCLQLCSSCD